MCSIQTMYVFESLTCTNLERTTDDALSERLKSFSVFKCSWLSAVGIHLHCLECVPMERFRIFTQCVCVVPTQRL